MRLQLSQSWFRSIPCSRRDRWIPAPTFSLCWANLCRVGVLAITATALAQPTQERASGFAYVARELKLSYPRDHGSHPDFRTEWWYLTGHLQTNSGVDLGFQFTIFRQALEYTRTKAADTRAVQQIFVGHLALALPSADRLRVAERIRRQGPLAMASETDLDLRLDDWSLSRVGADELALHAGDAAAALRLELRLQPEKALVLHGEAGYSQKGPAVGNASAYASWTRLAVAGSVILDGKSESVRGLAWFDHEYGTSQLPLGVVGWDWFSLQLDHGRELMLYQLRSAQGQSAPYSSGTLIEADGSSRHLSPQDFSIEALAHWQSPESGARYPARWRIRVPCAQLELTAEPMLAHCELDASASTGVIYWEGPILVEGSAAGRGYAELTGYATSLAAKF